MRTPRIFLTTLFLAVGGMTLLAQDEPPPDEKGNGSSNSRKGGGPGGAPPFLSIDKLKEELELTDEQAKKLQPLLNQVKALFDKMHKEREKDSKGGPQGKESGSKSGKGSSKKTLKDPSSKDSGPGKDMKEKMEEFQKKIVKILEPAKNFLSAEQYKKLIEKLTKRPAPPKGEKGGNGGKNGNGESDGPGKGGNGEPPEGDAGPGGQESASCSLKGSYTLSAKTAKISDETYSSNNKDTSAIVVKDNAVLTLNNVKIETSGNTSSQEKSSFYGLNAAVVVTQNSSATLVGGYVSTTGAGANAVFATGKNAKISLSNVKLTATGDGGHGVMATRGGSVVMKNVDIETSRERAGAIATDRGSGTIKVTGGTVTTSGKGSPVIYSTGDISATGLTGEALGAEVAVIEGSNSITLNNCTLSCNKLCGVMLYQSFSGDAEGSTGTLTVKNGSLTAKQGPVFYVTNAKGVITLENAQVSSSSGILVKAAGDRWGSEGENGGHAEFTAIAETLKGDLVCDKISTINASLKDETVLTGAIKGATLTLDGSSKWNVTADSTVKGLTVADGTSGIDRINSNGFNIKYAADATANKWLKGQTYTLSGGGKLLPGK